uniref:Uncharacterized protein n=1 Tax=Anguilla anguilla TaxID=7936 RepID=A0A0E9S6X2_ANGAN
MGGAAVLSRPEQSGSSSAVKMARPSTRM